MTSGQYLAIVVKQWKIILICFLVVGVGAYISGKLMTPLYQSAALVQVAIGSGSTDINNLLASDQLVQTEAVLATSDPVIREVASHYNGLTVDQLSKEVTVTPKISTQLFEIDVLDPSPARAAILANDIASTLIKKQMQMIQQDTAQSGNFLLIAQTAQPGLFPVQPNILLNTSVGILAGLFLGMLLAVLFERLDMRVRTAEALTELIGLPVLATIWLTPSEETVKPIEKNVNAESYRILRTNIGLSVMDKPLQSLVVTSAVAREGKSVVAANLAIFMARAGKNTLLIDADLHRPTQHLNFGLSNGLMGLSNAVMAMNMLTNVNSFSQHQFISATLSIRHSNLLTPARFSLEPFMHSVGIPNLRVMPSGALPPSPSELLDSKAMNRLFSAIGNCGAEVVIFDAPPVLGLSDTSILVPRVDGTLIVVDITRANKRNLKHLQTLIVKTGANVLGCVVNKQSLHQRDSYVYNEDAGQIHKANNNNSNMGSFPKVPVTPRPTRSVMNSNYLKNGKPANGIPAKNRR